MKTLKTRDLGLSSRMSRLPPGPQRSPHAVCSLSEHAHTSVCMCVRPVVSSRHLLPVCSASGGLWRQLALVGLHEILLESRALWLKQCVTMGHPLSLESCSRMRREAFSLFPIVLIQAWHKGVGQPQDAWGCRSPSRLALCVPCHGWCCSSPDRRWRETGPSPTPGHSREVAGGQEEDGFPCSAPNPPAPQARQWDCPHCPQPTLRLHSLLLWPHTLAKAALCVCST